MWGRLVESGKSRSTHTPSWVPLLFLPPWRRGPWHDFLSLVSIIESHSLFSGQSSRSKAAWIQNVCPPQGAMRHGVHTHPHRNSQKTKKCSKQPDSSKWRSGYSGLLHFLALHLKLAFWTLSECFGRVRADWLAGGRFTLGETNRLQSHKVL